MCLVSRFIKFRMYHINYTNTILFYFQLFAVCAFAPQKSIIIERLLIGWCIINFLILATISSLVVYYYKYIFFDSDAIGALTDVMQLAAPFCAHYIIIIESLYTKSKRLHVWQLMNQVDYSLTATLKINTSKMVRLGMKRYFIKAMLTQVICIATEIRIMAYIYPNLEWSRLWYAKFFTFSACRSNHLFYIFFVDMVKIRMEIIGEALLNLNRLWFVGGNSGKLQLRQLAVLKEAYTKLWNASQIIDIVFGWSVLINVTANFVCLSVNLYWNYAAMYFGSNPYWLESLMGSAPLIFILAVLCYSCEECHGKVSKACTHFNDK